MLALPAMDNLLENVSYFANGRRQGNSNCLEHLAARSNAGGANRKTSSIVFNRHLLQGSEVALNVFPLELMSGRFQSPVQFLAQDKSQKAAENMSTYGFIPFVEHSPGIEDGLHISKDLFHLPQFLVLESNPLSGKIHVGVQALYGKFTQNLGGPLAELRRPNGVYPVTD